MSEGRVFIVDDRPDEIRILGELLRAHGYDVELATTGQGGLEAIPGSAPTPGAGPRARGPRSPGMRGRWPTFPLLAGRCVGLHGAW